MKILSLHCDYIKFKPLKKAIKDPEELSEERKKEVEVKDPLGIFVAVEKSDENNLKKAIDNLVLNVLDLKDKVRAETIVLYPYAHLSSNLSNPGFALEVLEGTQGVLEHKGVKVFRAPFGYYKEFELKCKGHPLSELSREIKLEIDVVEQDIVVAKPMLKKEETYDPEKLLRNISQVKLDTSKLKDNDHRILGQKLGLFMFHDTAPGMPYWLPAGVTMYNELVNFWRIEHAKRGYQEITTPLMNKSELYKISGHWEHYKENMFIAHTDEDEDYCLKPMNCPNAMIVFKMQQRSYKDLPLRLSDTDRLHRFERSGTLNGLLRVRSFQQDDSHNFITEDMISSEYQEIFSICEQFYSLFGLKYSFRLGTRPEKFMGDPKIWDKAEATLKDILKKSGKKFVVQEGDGAFYGPKIDILMKDSMEREWQLGTLQLDFQLPQRFGLKYTDKDGKEKSPIVVHRVIYGSLERFIGVLLEHTNGNLPTWLSPVQVKVLSFTDRNEKSAQKVLDELKQAGIRAEADFSSTTVQDKVRTAALMKIPYVVTIGDKEEEKDTIALKRRGKDKPEFGVKLKDFLKEITEEIKDRK